MTKETYQIAKKLNHDLTVLNHIKSEQDKKHWVGFCDYNNDSIDSFLCAELQNDFREFIIRELEKTNKMFEDLSSVTPEEKAGKWTRELITNKYGGCIGAKMICSECGQDNGYDKRFRFCPNCGARMESEVNE